MKKLFLAIAFLLLFAGCDNPAECVKHTGYTVTKDIPVTTFDRIIVHRGIAMVITQDDNYSVSVVTGENLVDDIKATVTNGLLSLSDDTTCNWVRDYGQTIVYVTTPTLTQIESKTEQNISSSSVLTYPSLTLKATDLSGGAGTGDFHIQVSNNTVEINTNNVAAFYLSGQTANLVAGFYEGNGILKAQDLLAYSVYVFHRGSNNLYVHPTQSISGEIYSTGNVFCSPHPPEVNVNRHYQGRLIFE
ncbi:MAG TPA: head GIN domain-containing protein [Flavobacterium sp.]|nr:head GIN domain-containing protein [Flavobacterium sp.]